MYYDAKIGQLLFDLGQDVKSAVLEYCNTPVRDGLLGTSPNVNEPKV